MVKPSPAATPAETAAALAEHARRVAQLQRPGAYPHACDTVALVETHLSSLLFAGEHVYKLKKPLALPFVDFSTLQARREACEEELRLNTRTAPHHYLGVVPVVQGADGPAFGGMGPVLDWAVHMRRFDDRQRLDRLARQGLLGARHIDRLAEVVARFHAQLPPAPPGHGRAEVARHWARENIQELQALVTEPRQATLLAALAGWTEARGAQLAPQMELRRLTGHVREGHGDLHLANIAWVDDAPLLFDALEFNDTLRHLDTISELAFTFMDLHAHGLPRLAWRFISGVLEASGDHGALPLLSWHAVYRALVRSKVALLSARPLGLRGEALAHAGEAARGEAETYLRTAVRLARLELPAAAPCLVITGGLSGSGKSTVAALLAERLGALRVRSDVERKRLHGLAPTARASSALDLYGEAATRRTYARLHELAEMALQAGESMVVDAAFLRRDERLAMAALAARLGAGYRLVWCEAAPALLRARIAERWAGGQDPSDATPQVLEWQLRVAERPAADEAATLQPLRTDVPLDTLALRCEALPLPGAADDD